MRKILRYRGAVVKIIKMNDTDWPWEYRIIIDGKVWRDETSDRNAVGALRRAKSDIRNAKTHVMKTIAGRQMCSCGLRF